MPGQSPGPSIKNPLGMFTALSPDVVTTALRDQRASFDQLFRSPDMSPSLAANDSIDFISLNPEMRRDIRSQAASQIASNDITYLHIGEFRMRLVALPDDHISNIIALCTDKQVAWIDTRRGVTGVADYSRSINGTILELKGNTVRIQHEAPTITNLTIS